MLSGVQREIDVFNRVASLKSCEAALRLLARAAARATPWAACVVWLLLCVESHQALAAHRLTITRHRNAHSLSAALDGNDLKWAEGDPVRVPAGSRIIVYVEGTNTALYDFKLDAKEEELPQAAALKAFLPTLKGYVPGLLAGPSPAASVGSVPKDTVFNPQLERIVRAVDSVRRVELMTISSLSGMARPKRFLCERDLLCKSTDSYFVADTTAMLARNELIASLNLLAKLVDGHSDAEPALKAARATLEQSNAILEHVAAVEALAISARKADSTWADSVGVVAGTKTKTVELSFEPKSQPLLSAIAREDATKYSVIVEPRWAIRPSLGLGLLVSPGSRFPTYEAGSSGGAPVQSGTSDDRYTYGLSLAVTPDVFYHRDRITWWIGELTLNPSDNISAVGVGSALSWGVLKFTGGWLWTKHQIISGTRLEEGYGTPKGFLSIAVAGWLE